MRNGVTLYLSTGERVRVAGHESEITAKINAGRANNALLRLERDRVPTGQMLSVDPNAVVSVIGD